MVERSVVLVWCAFGFELVQDLLHRWNLQIDKDAFVVTAKAFSAVPCRCRKILARSKCHSSRLVAENRKYVGDCELRGLCRGLRLFGSLFGRDHSQGVFSGVHLVFGDCCASWFHGFVSIVVFSGCCNTIDQVGGVGNYIVATEYRSVANDDEDAVANDVEGCGLCREW